MTRRMAVLLAGIVVSSAALTSVMTSAVASTSNAVDGSSTATAPLCGVGELRARPGVWVITCLEIAPGLRRSVSRVLNPTSKTVTVGQVTSLISYPAYGETNCGLVVLTPGDARTCQSPWVATIPLQNAEGTVFTLVDSSPGKQSFTHVVPLSAG